MSTVTGGGNDFVAQVPPIGTHSARLVWMIDYGTQDKTFNGQKTGTVHRGQWWFELVDTNADFGKGKLEPFFVKTKELTYNLAGTSNTLRDYLGSFLQRAIVKNETIDLKQFIGAPCLLQVVHAKSKDGTKTYANIASIMSAPQGMAINPLRNQPIFFDIGSPDMFNQFMLITNKYVQGTIVKSPEFQQYATAAGFPWQQYQVAINNPAASPQHFVQAPQPQFQAPAPQQFAPTVQQPVAQPPSGQWVPPQPQWGQQQQQFQQAPPVAQPIPVAPPAQPQWPVPQPVANPLLQPQYQPPAPTPTAVQFQQPMAQPFQPQQQPQFQQPQNPFPQPTFGSKVDESPF